MKKSRTATFIILATIVAVVCAAFVIYKKVSGVEVIEEDED